MSDDYLPTSPHGNNGNGKGKGNGSNDKSAGDEKTSAGDDNDDDGDADDDDDDDDDGGGGGGGDDADDEGDDDDKKKSKKDKNKKNNDKKKKSNQMLNFVGLTFFAVLGANFLEGVGGCVSVWHRMWSCLVRSQGECVLSLHLEIGPSVYLEIDLFVHLMLFNSFRGYMVLGGLEALMLQVFLIGACHPKP